MKKTQQKSTTYESNIYICILRDVPDNISQEITLCIPSFALSFIKDSESQNFTWNTYYIIYYTGAYEDKHMNIHHMSIIFIISFAMLLFAFLFLSVSLPLNIQIYVEMLILSS